LPALPHRRRRDSALHRRLQRRRVCRIPCRRLAAGGPARNGDYSVDELIAVCISRQVVDGEILAHGIGTPLVAAGNLLARLTHAPNVTFISAIAQALCRAPAPLGITTVE